MNLLKKSLICALLTLSSTCFAAEYQLVNSGKDFKVYVDAYKRKSSDEQWTGFKSFASKYEKYYAAGVCTIGETECDKTLRGRLTKFFAALPNFETAMWKTFEDADHITDEQVRRFKRAFPDLKANVPIIFLPSLLGFNGRAVEINKQNVLMMAPDSLLNRKDPVDVVFSHEFFHVYQFDRLEGTKNFYTMASFLWFEGFATWVSAQQNPGTSDSTALVDAELGKFCGQASNVQSLAKLFVTFDKMSLNDPKAEATNDDWFLMKGTTLPKRRGYCLGLQMFKKITAQRSFKDLVGLDEEHFTPLLHETLLGMSK